MSTARNRKHFVRVQTIGTIRWECPDCGRINAHKLSIRRWRLTCGGCQAEFIFSSLIRSIPNGGCVPPNDNILPVNDLQPIDALEGTMPWVPEWDSAMPISPVIRYKSRSHANMLCVVLSRDRYETLIRLAGLEETST